MRGEEKIKYSSDAENLLEKCDNFLRDGSKNKFLSKESYTDLVKLRDDLEKKIQNTYTDNREKVYKELSQSLTNCEKKYNAYLLEAEKGKVEKSRDDIIGLFDESEPAEKKKVTEAEALSSDDKLMQYLAEEDNTTQNKEPNIQNKELTKQSWSEYLITFTVCKGIINICAKLFPSLKEGGRGRGE